MRLQVRSAILLFAVGACAGEPGSPASAPHRDRSPRRPEALAARLRTPGLRADFTAQGATVGPARGAAWRFQATPRGFGCDGALAELGKALPAVRGDRVEYARPELLEWYVESPRGLEQGFTIPAPPACRRRGARGVVVALGGGLGAVVADGSAGRAARLHDASGKDVLRYTDLHVVDAAGSELPARLEARGEGLVIRFDDAGARYPVVVDPMMWAEQQELLAGDGAVGDAFGTSVSVSGDAALVGAPTADAQGAVYAFVRSGTTWVQQQRLAASDGNVLAEFGASVSLSGDTALIGAYGENQDSGAAYFFVRSSTSASWAPLQEMSSPNTANGTHFGRAVVVAGDTALVGQSNLGAGFAYVYTRAGATWAVQQELAEGAPDAGTGDEFGAAVALDGDTAIVGAPAAGGNGAAYVFVRSGTTWSLEQQLTAADGAVGDSFGSSVAVEGDTAIVAAATRMVYEGALYVFTRSGTTWTQQQEILPALTTAVGTSVALSGGVVASGGYVSDDGVAWVYALTGGSLMFQQLLVPVGPPPSGSLFGGAVALDGATLIAGAPGQVSHEGAAYVFSMGSAAGDACTSAGACLSGYCVDGVCCAVPSCPAAGPCNDVETCLPGTGACSFSPLHEGMTCTQGPCWTPGTCQSGVCTGSPVVCAPADDCHEFGTCDPASGMCENPAKPDGQPCANGGMCAGGVCVAPSPGAGASGGHGGCGCEVNGDGGGGALAAGVGFLLLARRRRRGGRWVGGR